MNDDHRSYIHNFYSWEKKAWKKFRLVRDSNPWPLRYRCSALPIKLHRYCRGQGFESRTAGFFLFRLSFRNCKSCVHNCHDHPSFNSSFRSSHNMIFIYSKLHLKKHSCTLLVVLIFNNYWTRLSKISWFVCGKQINYLPKPKAEANNWSARHWQIAIF